MNPWLAWGTPLILWMQRLSPGLDGPMKLLSFLGTEEFYLLVMPALLWCYDAALGLRVGLILLTSNGVNAALKLTFGWPRPYWVSGQVRPLSAETSFGMPSGHAQNATAVWVGLAAWLRRRWAYVLFGLLALLIGLSRPYLGVHFPTDVLAGWLVGGLLLWAFLRLEEPFRRRLETLQPGGQVLVAFAASLALLALSLAAFAATANRAVPQEWFEAAAAALPQAKAIDPRSLKGPIAAAGTLFGLGAGGVLLFNWGGFDAGGLWWKRSLRYLLGVIGVVVLYYGLKLIFPAGDTLLAYTLRYIRYALVGFWVVYLAPRTFTALSVA